MERRRIAPTSPGRLIDAGYIHLGGSSDLRASAKHRNRRETRQVAVEHYAQLRAEAEACGEPLVVPEPTGRIVLECMRDGALVGQGRSRPLRPLAEREAIEAAWAEASNIRKRFRDRAKAEGRPPGWAPEEAAKTIRELMLELGAANPPAITTIMRRRAP